MGMPFSGKSTLSKAIAKHKQIPLVGFDSMWEAEKLNLKEGMSDVEEWEYIKKKSLEKIEELIKQGKSAVYDDTNPKKEHRDQFRAVANKLSMQTRVVFVDTPIDVIIERQKENESSQERHSLSKENFENIKSQMELPGEDENVIVFTPQDDLQKWLSRLN